MAIAKVATVSITHPTQEEAGTSIPIISQARNTRIFVNMKLDLNQQPPRVRATTQQRGMEARTFYLGPMQVELLHQHTRKAHPVGLAQPNYAATLLRWISEGLIDIQALHDHLETMPA